MYSSDHPDYDQDPDTCPHCQHAAAQYRATAAEQDHTTADIPF